MFTFSLDNAILPPLKEGPHNLDMLPVSLDDAFFKHMVDHLLDGAYVIDGGGTIRYANDSLARMLGYQVSNQIVGCNLFGFIAPDHLGEIARLYDSGKSIGFAPEPIAVHLTKLDGASFWAEVAPSGNSGETLAGISFGTVRNITEQFELQKYLQHMATTDELTGLNNRRGFKLLAQQTMRHCAESLQQLVLVSLDVDDFKQINDGQGHQAGDLVLNTVAGMLQAAFRSTDVIARWGGDEFLVLASDSPSGSVEQAVGTFNNYLNRFNSSAGDGTEIHVSIGWYAGPAVSLNELIDQADKAMYRNKPSGKGQSC